LSSDSVFCVYEDSTGVLWIGTIGAGLDKFDRETGIFRNYRARPNDPSSLSSNSIVVIFEDSRGKFWVGTLGGGINIFERETEHFHTFRNIPDDPASLSDNGVWCIYEDRDGVLWIGTGNGGLNTFNRKTETFTRYRSNLNDPASLSSDNIRSIYQDPTGILWLGTYGGGLNKFDPRKGVCTRHYREKHGLPNDVVYGILPDDQGYLWLSTNKGLSKFDPRTETFKNYTPMDGLQSNEFNGGACYKSKSGEMFFGGVNGFNAFYPDEVKDNRNIPPIVITDFQIFNQSVGIGGDSPLQKHITETNEIKLSYKENAFSFKFVALDYTIPGKNQYRYMMEGFDKDRIFTDASRRFASYTNLDPGEYIFRVKGSNNDGVWNEKGTSIKIIITPPFWQTWWFRLLGIIAISFLILTVYKIRTYSIRKRSIHLEEINAALNTQITERKMLEEKLLRQEKLAVLGQLAGGVGHELRNPLGAIKNSVYFLNMVLEKPLPEVKETLEILEKEVTTSDRIISSLLDFARSRPPRKQKVNINNIIQEAIFRINVPETIEVKSQIEEFIPTIIADPDQLGQIFGNILLNAIQAMPEGGQLMIKTEALSPDWVTVSITDTGVGIPRENLEKIFEPLFTSKAKGIGLGPLWRETKAVSKYKVSQERAAPLP
jgi:signal transduction histidine kinase/streptogramin lyase